MKDEFFATDPSSPLTPRQRARFRGLAYFPPNPELAVEAELHAYAHSNDADLMTSFGDTERFRRAGVVWFEVAGVRTAITLFRSDRGRLFVPFRDGTSGTETYGAGRYLLDTAKGADLGAEGDLLVLDFNFAYQPSCSYDPRWVCPLAPPENRLPIEVRAGERMVGKDAGGAHPSG
jgi:uncharacterized protein (DUF1684 family)